MRFCFATLITLIAVPALASPAPATARSFPKGIANFPYFATPSGRIACEYRAGRVTCTTFTGSLEGQDTWYVKTRGRGHFDVANGNFPAESVPRAKYGVTYAYSSIKCRIHTTKGIKCWNRAGHGFQVSLEAQRTFDHARRSHHGRFRGRYRCGSRY